MDARKEKVPVLKGYVDGPSVVVWCPFCAAWHSHGLTDDLLKSRGTSHRAGDCGHYPRGYYVQLFTRGEIEQIYSSLRTLDDLRRT